MNRKQKKLLRRILLAAAMMVLLHFVPVQGLLRFGLYLIPYAIAGHDILTRAVRGILRGQVFDENFLMALATVGALVLGLTRTGDYVEAVAVMVFYQLGELFQSVAVGKSRRSIAALMDIRPDYATLDTGERVDPEEVAVGSTIRVAPGERVPLDAVVLEGFSSLDTVTLTGESVPRDVGPGDPVVSGCVNMSGLLRLKTTKEYGQSTVARILDLVENASSRKSRSEDFIARFARVYTPAVCLSALALAVLPPVLAPDWGDWSTWLYRALTFLVASCPCALVISIPLSFFAGIGGAGKAGILVKGSNYLEALSKTHTVAFDKTGTLTQGVFQVSGVRNNRIPEESLIQYAALAESASSHPISRSLRQAWSGDPAAYRVEEIRELSGRGVTAQVEGKTVAVGNGRLMEELDIAFPAWEAPGTVVHVALDGQYAGSILISDRLKPEAAQVMTALKGVGVRETVMLTGDNEAAARSVAEQLGITRVFSGLLPGDKVTAVETLLNRKPAGTAVAFVGDGINDAPVLARADIGIAMGAMGSDAAIEAADIVLMDDDPRKLAQAIGISRKTLGIVYQNTVFAISVKLLALVLVALGAANMWLAIFADVGVMVLAVLNAVRAMFVKKL